jgi:hypothetical protein
MVHRSTPAIACALLAACIACGSDNRDDSRNPAADRQHDQQAAPANEPQADQAAQAQSVSLDGCVQKGAGMLSNDYLLTTLNEPPGMTGTSGSVTRTGSSVEREQMRMASQMYRLESMADVKLDDMVGKQVRVTGVIAKASNVPNGNGAIGSDQDTQRPNRDQSDRNDRNPRITTADLARFDVSSATVINQSCGARGSETSGRTSSEMVGTDRGPRVRR